MDYDLVSIGEPLLRLSPRGFRQLRRAASFDLFVVGSQLNVAANLARLGKKTTFLTKIPCNSLGYLVLDACKDYGVDTRHIRIVPEGKIGVAYVEFSVAPRPPVTLYDRKGSAASTIEVNDFSWDDILSGSKIAYSDGIFTGLSQSCLTAFFKFFETAKSCDCQTFFDLNFREHLWKPLDARKVWTKLKDVDVMVTNRTVSEIVFGHHGTDEKIMREYARHFGCRIVCMTHRKIRGLQHGAWNSKALVDGKLFEGKPMQFDIIDRYGTGDAWLSGFIYAYLEKNDVKFALDYGNALCALAHTALGDITHFTADEVKSLIDEKTSLRLRR